MKKKKKLPFKTVKGLNNIILDNHKNLIVTQFEAIPELFQNYVFQCFELLKKKKKARFWRNFFFFNHGTHAKVKRMKITFLPHIIWDFLTRKDFTFFNNRTKFWKITESYQGKNGRMSCRGSGRDNKVGNKAIKGIIFQYFSDEKRLGEQRLKSIPKKNFLFFFFCQIVKRSDCESK